MNISSVLGWWFPHVEAAGAVMEVSDLVAWFPHVAVGVVMVASVIIWIMSWIWVFSDETPPLVAAICSAYILFGGFGTFLIADAFWMHMILKVSSAGG